MRRRLWFLLLPAVGLTLSGMVVPYVLPDLLKSYEPRLTFRGDASKRTLSLTIDDAPSGSTNEILAVLARHKVRATFFVISGRVRPEADLRGIVDAGHALGHHMRTTQACSRLSLDEFKADFDATDLVLKKYYPATAFRPPSDFGTPQQLEYAIAKGYTPVLGTVFPLDHWIERPWALALLDRWLAIPGGILIMHDGDGRGRRTAAVLDQVIPALKAAGYEFERPESLTSRKNQAL